MYWWKIIADCTESIFLLKALSAQDCSIVNPVCPTTWIYILAPRVIEFDALALHPVQGYFSDVSLSSLYIMFNLFKGHQVQIIQLLASFGKICSIQWTFNTAVSKKRLPWFTEILQTPKFRKSFGGSWHHCSHDSTTHSRFLQLNLIREREHFTSRHLRKVGEECAWQDLYPRRNYCFS